MSKSAKEKSKMTYFLGNKASWQPGKRAKYMSELTRKQTSLIFKARSRMIKVKGNYKNGHPDLLCRMCKIEEETQGHVLDECQALHPNDAIKVPISSLFNEDTDTLRQIAKNLEKITEKLSEVVY